MKDTNSKTEWDREAFLDLFQSAVMAGADCYAEAWYRSLGPTEIRSKLRQIRRLLDLAESRGLPAPEQEDEGGEVSCG